MSMKSLSWSVCIRWNWMELCVCLCVWCSLLSVLRQQTQQCHAALRSQRLKSIFRVELRFVTNSKSECVCEIERFAAAATMIRWGSCQMSIFGMERHWWAPNATTMELENYLKWPDGEPIRMRYYIRMHLLSPITQAFGTIRCKGKYNHDAKYIPYIYRERFVFLGVYASTWPPFDTIASFFRHPPMQFDCLACTCWLLGTMIYELNIAAKRIASISDHLCVHLKAFEQHQQTAMMRTSRFSILFCTNNKI